MTIQEIVQKLKEEINGKNNKEIIESYETQLSKENIEELSKNEEFFKLPLKNIFSLISQVDFNSIEENEKIIEIIQNIIKNIINKHFDEKETILILQNLNIKPNLFSYEEIFSLFELITNCPLLFTFCNLYKEHNKLGVDLDYEYELEQKDKEIEIIHQTIKKYELPDDFEIDIFKACKEGTSKLSNG